MSLRVFSRLNSLLKVQETLLIGGRRLGSSNSFKIQDVKDFEERVKSSKKPVIVDFFATWCNPCRTLTPRLESVIEERKGEVLLAKVDIDENTDLAMDYEVGAVPVLLVMREGKVLERLVGLQDTDKLRKFIDQAIEAPVPK